MIDLNSYRVDQKKWVNASYKAAKSEDRGTYDSNEKLRYSILLSLQYDLKDNDEELVRFLFEQEVVARENDSFQGIGNALWLGAFLLSKYRKVEDIPLFYRAKFANFDTSCGFDREFIYLALRNKTEDYVLTKFPEIHEETDDYRVSFVGRFWVMW